MNSRERILATLRHQEPDRVPIDIGGTGVTGINLNAYANLKKHLGLTGGMARVFHTWIQVPELEPEIAARLHSDTVTLPRYKMSLGVPNVEWKPFTFDFIPDAPFLVPAGFSPERNEEGDYVWFEHGIKLAEQPIEGKQGYSLRYHPLRDATTEREIDEWFETYDGNFMGRIRVTDEELVWARDLAVRLRETNKAVIADYFGTVLENAQGIVGWDTIYMLMLSQPDLARYFFERLTHELVTGIKRYLSALGEYIDVFMFADDLGHQRGPMLKPELYRQMVWPGHRAVFQAVKDNSRAAVFFHTDGTVISLLPDLIDAGMDIFNPVQTDAAQMDPAELKRRFGQNITLWGGGVDTHRILPFGTPEHVREDVRRRIQVMAPGGGYVFASIHNMLGDAPPENILAAVDSVLENGSYPLRQTAEEWEVLAAHLSAINYWKEPLENLEAGR
jgi:uroporphyrinogen decarboxylase